MAEYIEREAVGKNAFRYLLPNGEESPKVVFLDAIDKIPTADVAPVRRGEWYGEADGYADGELVYDIWSCPICGKRFDEWDEKPDWNYCPNCGARMDGDHEPAE